MIGLITRRGADILWGGDLKALEVIRKGMEDCGVHAELVFDFSDIERFDFLFLSNTCFDLRPSYNALKLHGKRFGLIGFHEDLEMYKPSQMGFFKYVQKCIKGELQVESLWENPEAFFPFKAPLVFDPSVNWEILKEAEVCIGSSPTEVATMKRDSPGCKAHSVLFTSGFVESENLPSDCFLKFSQQSSKGYILQVGRFEERKNQLATILATKEIDIPLVFIATVTTHLDYEEACLRAIMKYRKAPTLIISQLIPSMQSGHLKILQMPEGKILSSDMLVSAFFHAALHLHPAFYELPGYTYLESVKLGIPTIASSWATISDYFKDDRGQSTLDARIEYALPYDIPALEKLVHKKIGERYDPYPSHKAFSRKAKDVAQEILSFF